MRQKRFVLNSGRAFYWYPYFCISFFTRMMAMEVCFGDVDEEEPNLAYSILKSIMKTSMENRGRCLQNIILAGGGCMIPGFKLRLL